MASARQDFERYVRWLHQPERAVPDDVKRLAALVLQSFEKVMATSRQRSQRSAALVELVRAQLATTAAEMPSTEVEDSNDAWPWAKLHHLTLGPFRGFRTAEPFDLSKQVTLIYGPNGSGKTSLCEGLEYALLGEVQEAGTKRIAANTYLANVHDGRFAPPVLTATDHCGRQIDVNASSDLYRFCFLEKNRIDAFSRLAARPAAQRAELIATLFGMGQFNDFVSHFNESIDGQLVLDDVFQVELTAKRNALAVDQEVVASAAESLLALAGEEVALASEYAPNLSFMELKATIGSAELPGRMQELDRILEVAPQGLYGVTRQTFLAQLGAAREAGERLDHVAAELLAMSDQVSFKALYSSVLALREVVGNQCPACDTPLGGVGGTATDPYLKAENGLKMLGQLGDLQDQRRAAEALLGEAARALRQAVASIAAFLVARAEEATLVGRWASRLPKEPKDRWWESMQQQQPAADAEVPSLQEVVSVIDRMVAHDVRAEQLRQDRRRHVAERDRLREFQLRVQAQDIKRQQVVQGIGAARCRISAFDEANADLISQVAQERLDIARDAPFKVAYDRFLEELRVYRDQLPAQLLSGLNDVARDLYNSFNRNDRDEDKLSSLHLPLLGSGKIELSFRGSPGIRMDALHVLSEGHIRCLGLAILMAKARSIGCPVIIFDDAINAIDHDHRGGIREAIFEADDFAQTQLILTCHSNEFIKDIQQHLPAARRSSCQVYLLRHHGGDYQPRVSGNISTASYIGRARAARELLNDREALAASRQALEMLSEKTWRWLGSHGYGLLSLQLAGAGAAPNLRNLCEALVKRLGELQAFQHANKEQLMADYRTILGIPADNLIWGYLNKGTHEEADRDDFDGELVEAVVQTLERLDGLDLRTGR